MDKPAGKTSHDIVGVVRRVTKVRRVGHTGTLDPFATGVLPVLVGPATRLARFLSGMDKTYTGSLRLGTTTDSDDSTGQVMNETGLGAQLSADDIRTAMTELTGNIEQTPPALSAKKIGGVAAHRRVRRGEQVTMQPVSVQVHAFTLAERDGPVVEFCARVSSGTYIRSLARDLGLKLGCGAHLTALRRTEVGPFHIRNAVPLAGLTLEAVQSVEHAIEHLPMLSVGVEETNRLLHGQAVDAEPDAVQEAVAMMGPEGLIGIGEVAGGRLQPRVVLSG